MLSEKLVFAEKTDIGKCPVCFHDSDHRTIVILNDKNEAVGRQTLVVCSRCGEFRVSQIVLYQLLDEGGPLGQKISRNRADLSAFIQERQRKDGPALLISDDFFNQKQHDSLGDVFRSLPSLTFFQKADKLLKALSADQPTAGRDIDLVPEREKWQARAWALDQEEFEAIIDYLYHSERLDNRIAHQYDVTRIFPLGWRRLEEIELEGGTHEQGFVAMWFDEELDPLYNNAIHPAIECAGYVPIRIDKQPGEERIDHRIEVALKESRFVIADFTGHRGGVYFEAGFARAFGKPVFFTCHKDDFDNLHFDTRQFNCLSWDCNTFEKLKNDLRYSIENVCGKGPVHVDTVNSKNSH